MTTILEYLVCLKMHKFVNVVFAVTQGALSRSLSMRLKLQASQIASKQDIVQACRGMTHGSLWLTLLHDVLHTLSKMQGLAADHSVSSCDQLPDLLAVCWAASLKHPWASHGH